MLQLTMHCRCDTTYEKIIFDGDILSTFCFYNAQLSTLSVSQTMVLYYLLSKICLKQTVRTLTAATALFH